MEKTVKRRLNMFINEKDVEKVKIYLSYDFVREDYYVCAWYYSNSDNNTPFAIQTFYPNTDSEFDDTASMIAYGLLDTLEKYYTKSTHCKSVFTQCC